MKNIMYSFSGVMVCMGVVGSEEVGFVGSFGWWVLSIKTTGTSGKDGMIGSIMIGHMIRRIILP
jgi:hypothetical protein